MSSLSLVSLLIFCTWFSVPLFHMCTHTHACTHTHTHTLKYLHSERKKLVHIFYTHTHTHIQREKRRKEHKKTEEKTPLFTIFLILDGGAESPVLSTSTSWCSSWLPWLPLAAGLAPAGLKFHRPTCRLHMVHWTIWGLLLLKHIQATKSVGLQKVEWLRRHLLDKAWKHGQMDPVRHDDSSNPPPPPIP